MLLTIPPTVSAIVSARDVPSTVKLVAVIIPQVILPLEYMVAAVPTCTPPVAVVTPVILTLLKNVAGVPV